MDQPPGRPPGVWITQALLLFFLIALAITLVASLFKCVSIAQRATCAVTLPELLASLLMLAFAGLAFWGLQQRQRYGQWMAVILLAGAMIVGIVDSPLPRALRVLALSLFSGGGSLPDPLQACNHPFGDLTYLCGYASYHQLAWEITSDLLPSLLLGFLAYRLLYGHPARRFFQR